MYTNDSINYCKPILIQVPEIFARFTRPLLSQTFLVANQSPVWVLQQHGYK